MTPPADPASAPPRRRFFLLALAIAALAVGLPLAVLAVLWGIEVARAHAPGANVRESVCRIGPPTDGGAGHVEELELRRRIAALESELARRGAACPICGEAEESEVALVVDTSISMRWPATMDAAAEAAQMERIKQETGDPLTTPAGNQRMQQEMNRTPAEQQRMEAARRAALAVLEALPRQAIVRLYSFGRVDPTRVQDTVCKVAEVGRFANADRPRLQQGLRGLQPDAGGTPLAQSIAQAAGSSKNRPAGRPGFVVIITDGLESCRGDPCAAAAAARAADPGLTITVIDIAGNPQVSCLAEATGGRLFKAEAGGDAGKLIAEAFRPPPPRACIPRPS